jgi:hypothetical protein
VKSKTVDYSQELYADVMDHMVDYHQTGWTVCGAERRAGKPEDPKNYGA